MATEQEEFLTVSSFKVSIDGHTWEVYETVSGLGLEIEDLPFAGDKNVTWNRPGRCTARDITLVRRFKKDKELYTWFKDIKSGKTIRKSGSILLLNDEGSEVCRFNFFGAWPKSWSAPALSKDVRSGNDILKETIVLSVQDVEMA
jgi:phage tail-like protein